MSTGDEEITATGTLFSVPTTDTISSSTSAPGKSRRLPDWIDSFLDITSDAPSPARFRLWAGITAISAAAEKRIWTRTGKSWQTEFDVFPSLYTLLVSPPAIGKGQAIGPVEKIWHSAKGAITGRLKVAPRSMTKASLVDEMAKAQRHIPLNKFAGTDALSIEFLEYSSLAILAEELGVLISSHDLDFLSLLTEIYNSKAVYSETRRTNKLSVEVFNPQITFLGGTQPAFLASILPEEAWGMGAMSRIILIYSGTGVKKQLFPEDDLFDNVVDIKMRSLQRSIVSDFSQILDLYGEMKWSAGARRAAVEWTNAGMPPIPTHSKLVHYCGRRDLHCVKLSMIASLSRSNSLIVAEEDFRRAQGWMLEAEEVMPDVFREMTGKSDGELIKQLNFYMFSVWMRNGRKPMHESFLINFLITRTTSDRIERIISMAERANIIAREAGTNLWFPRRADEHGQVD